MAKEESKEKKAKTRQPTAKKIDIQNEKRRMRSRSFKASVRTAIRQFEAGLAEKDSAAIKERLSFVYSMMDKGVKRSVFKQNKANRTKARLTARLQAKA